MPAKCFILFLALIAVFPVAVKQAYAHSFNVALVVPQNMQGKQLVEGFLLAASERDGHPDQESDGHLGGLDVYVTIIKSNADASEFSKHAEAERAFDIIAVAASSGSHAEIRKSIGAKNYATLFPGETPFAQSEVPAVANFISSYQSKYRRPPTRHAAQGYNLARRIDAAVRSRGDAKDKVFLMSQFENSKIEFNW